MSNRRSICSRARLALAGATLAGLLATFVLAAPAAAWAAGATRTTRAAAHGRYGAIAINVRTGDAGVSKGQFAAWYAKDLALNSCRGDCTVAVWVRNGCAAVVHDPRWFVPGIGATRAAAIRNAKYRAHARDTQLVAWTCSVG
jgi:hypothetical protein